MNHRLKALALASALTISGSSAALGVESNSVNLTQVDVEPFISVSGLAATIDFDQYTGASVFGGDSPAANVTMTPGGGVDVETNAAGGYRISVGFSELTGAVSSTVIPHTAYDLNVVGVSPAIPGNEITYLNGMTGLGAYFDYAAASSGDIEDIYECDGGCTGYAPGAESWELMARLNVPAEALADAYGGAWTFRASSL